MRVETIRFCGQQAKVRCDANCGKAWGNNSRPKKMLSGDPDDYEFLADHELGEAPVDPGTYEGQQGKPASPDEFPNKWCVRECERCSMSMPGEHLLPIELKDFSVRRANMR